MDGTIIGELASEVSQYLLPFLPYLIKGVKIGGQEFFKEIGAQSGERAAALIDQLWAKLRPSVSAQPKSKQILEAVAQEPRDVEAADSFRLLLAHALNDQQLGHEIAALLRKADEEGITLESIITIREHYGSLLGIDVADTSGLASGTVNSKINIDKTQPGSSVIGIGLGSARRKKKN